MKFTLKNDDVFGSLAVLDVIGEKEPDGVIGLKVARLTKAVRTCAIEINEERVKLINKYGEKYPEGHAKAGQFTPRYKDDAKPEDRREDNPAAIMDGERNCTDTAALAEELKALGAAESELECPQLTEKDIVIIAKLGLKPKVIEPLLWNVEKTAADQAA